MPKDKTRNQKKIADLRKQLYSLKSIEVGDIKSSKLTSLRPAASYGLASSTSVPVVLEIKKTSAFILTALLIEGLLFIALKTKTIAIPGLSY